MTKQTPSYSSEVRARVVRMVLDHQGEHALQWAAINSITESLAAARPGRDRGGPLYRRATDAGDGTERGRSGPDGPDDDPRSGGFVPARSGQPPVQGTAPERALGQ